MASIENETAGLLRFALSWGRKGVPQHVEKEQNGIITWGRQNNYHELLYKLYNESAIHKGLIEGKKHYITSGGVSLENGNQSDFDLFLENGTSADDFKDIYRMLTLDLLILNAMAFVVTLSVDRKRCRLDYLDAGKVRIAKDGSIRYKEDWNNRSEKEQVYERYSGDPKQFRFIVYWREKPKSSDDKSDFSFYPKPEYIGAINDIISSVQISKFRMLEVLNGFKGGTLITMQKPRLPEDEEKIIEDIKEGAANNEGKGFITVTFVENGENEPKIHNLTGNDLDKRYLTTEEAIINNIFIGHSVTSPALFGIKTPGQIGMSNELEMAFNIFVNTYISGKLNIFSEIFNWLWADVLGHAGKIIFNPPRSLFQSDDTLASRIASLPITLQQLVVSKLTDDEIRALVGLEPTNEPLNDKVDEDIVLTGLKNCGRDKSLFDVIAIQPIPHGFTPEQIAQMEQETRAKFAHTFALNKKDAGVLDAIVGGLRDADEIASKTGLKQSEVVDILAKLIDGGQISANLEPLVEVPQTRFEIVYDYDLRADAPPLKEGGESRPFCKTLIGLNKFWTRDEIDQISQALAAQGVKRGFDQYPDVWRYRGGWYHNPKTGQNTPFCRHEWRQVVVTLRG